MTTSPNITLLKLNAKMTKGLDSVLNCRGLKSVETKLGTLLDGDRLIMGNKNKPIE